MSAKDPNARPIPSPKCLLLLLPGPGLPPFHRPRCQEPNSRGPPEQQLKEHQPTMASHAVPYTGGDVKKSGEHMLTLTGKDTKPFSRQQWRDIRVAELEQLVHGGKSS
ncbi:hypothetical protein TB2_034770 [Malus domestica]